MQSRFDQSCREQSAVPAGPPRTQLGCELLSEAALSAAFGRALGMAAGNRAAAGDDALVAGSSLGSYAAEALLVLAFAVLDTAILALGLVDQVALAATAIVPHALLGGNGLLVVVTGVALELVESGLTRRRVLLVLDVSGTSPASGEAAGSESWREVGRARRRASSVGTGSGSCWAEPGGVACTTTSGGELGGLAD